MASPRTVEVQVQQDEASEITAERGPGYTENEVARGEFPPLLALVSPELAAEVRAMRRPTGEPWYVPRVRAVGPANRTR